MKNSKNSGSNRLTKAQQALLKDLQDVLPDKYIKFDIVSAAAAGILETAGSMTGSRNIAGQGTKIQKGAYQRIAAQMQTFLNNFTDIYYQTLNQIDSQVDAKTLNAAINKISKVTQQFLNQVSNITKGSSAYDSEFKTYTTELNDIIKNLDKKISIGSEDALAELNGLVSVLSAGIEGTAFKGDIGEAIANIAGQNLGAIAGSKVQQVLTEGAKTSNRGYNKAFFTANTDFNKLLNKKTNNQIGNFLITSSALQDKVDVSIQLKNQKEISLSVKNYGEKSMQKGFMFESAHLLELLQNENDDNFINHYLNLNAIRGLTNSAEKKQINILIKKIIAAKIIAGYNYYTQNGNMKEADYFVVINNTTYTAEVYSMKDIFEKLINTGKYDNIKLPTNFISQNKWQTHMSTRLTNVMKVLAANSGSLTITQSDLKKIK